MIARLLATEVLARLEGQLSSDDYQRCGDAVRKVSELAEAANAEMTLEEFLPDIPNSFAKVEHMRDELTKRVDRFTAANEEPFREPWLECLREAREFYRAHGEDVAATAVWAEPMEWSERMPHPFNSRYAVSGGTAGGGEKVAVSVRVSRTLFDHLSLEATWFILSHEFICHSFAATLGARHEASHWQAFPEGWMEAAALYAHTRAFRTRLACVAQLFDQARLELWREDAAVAKLCPTAPESEAVSAKRNGWTIGADGARWTELCFQLVLGTAEGTAAWAKLSVALNRSGMDLQRLYEFAEASRALLMPGRASGRGQVLDQLIIDTATTFGGAASQAEALTYAERIIEIWHARRDSII